MRNKNAIVYLICLVLFSISCNSKRDSSDIAEQKNDAKFDRSSDERDADFLVEMTSLLYGLVDFTNVALDKESVAARTALSVRPDYQSLLNEIKSYASSHAVSIPNEASEKLEHKMNHLIDEKGEKFDKKWCRQAKKANEELIKKIETFGDKTQNMNLKNWLNGVLPRVRAIQDKFLDMEIKLQEE